MNTNKTSKTFYKVCFKDEVVAYTSRKAANQAIDDSNESPKEQGIGENYEPYVYEPYIIEFQGYESEHGYVYDTENDATYTIVE